MYVIDQHHYFQEPDLISMYPPVNLNITKANDFRRVTVFMDMYLIVLSEIRGSAELKPFHIYVFKSIHPWGVIQG